jgi:invasion protein IalB
MRAPIYLRHFSGGVHVQARRIGLRKRASAVNALPGVAKPRTSREERTMIFRTALIACLTLAIASPALAETAAKKTQGNTKATPKAAAKTAPKAKAGPDGAGGPQLVSQYGEWGAYVASPKGRICYVLAEPKSRKPKLNRDPGYIFITTRPAENVRNELSVVAGFPLKEGSDATLSVGGMDFLLYTKGDSAWLKNAAEEAKLIEALRKQRDLTVKTTSTRGNVTTDHYSLSGISQALDRVAQECK